MIQTKISTNIFKGLNLLIEPKQITSPSGNDMTSVNINNKHVKPKPSNKYKVTSRKLIYNPTFFEKKNL